MIHSYNIYYFIDKFDRDEILNLDPKIDIIYRNYKNEKIDNIIKNIKKCCKIDNRKFFLSNNLKIAKKYQLDGLYIPSFNNKLNYKNLNKQKNFKIIGSAHNKKEIIIKKKQGCDLIFLSPLFKNAKSKFFLGITKFNLIALNSSTKIIGLGGINEKNIRRLYCSKVKGFASISWIKKNRPKKLGRLI
tara:strand:+ start:1 stop:564 length:564 start_codon:yes stop_codon:yes gene_type:complete